MPKEFVLLVASLIFVGICFLKSMDYSNEGKFSKAEIWGAAGLICALIIAIETIRRIEMLR